MKLIIAKIIWSGIIIACILLAVFGFVINVREIAPYFSYPKAEALVLKVHNYQKSSRGQDIEYLLGSKIK